METKETKEQEHEKNEEKEIVPIGGVLELDSISVLTSPSNVIDLRRVKKVVAMKKPSEKEQENYRKIQIVELTFPYPSPVRVWRENIFLKLKPSLLVSQETRLVQCHLRVDVKGTSLCSNVSLSLSLTHLPTHIQTTGGLFSYRNVTDGSVEWEHVRIGLISKIYEIENDFTLITLKPRAQKKFRNVKLKYCPKTFVEMILKSREWWCEYEWKCEARKYADEEEETKPWNTIEIEMFTKRHFEILVQRGIDIDASETVLPNSSEIIRLRTLNEADSEWWINRLKKCLPKRIDVEVKESHATMLCALGRRSSSSMNRELMDGNVVFEEIFLLLEPLSLSLSLFLS